MRKNILTGLVLAVAAVLVVVLSDLMDLELASVALLGAALGAVIALVPDGTPVTRLVGFAAGFAAAWVGYIFRAGLMPDTSTGRAVAAAFVVVLCTAVAAASRDRITLWSTLLGAAALAGGYEFTFSAAPPEILDTSLSTATTLLFAVGLGFLAAALIAPAGDAPAADRRRVASAPAPQPVAGHLDDLMETSK